MAYIEVYDYGSTIIVMANPPIQIAKEWCEKFGGKIDSLGEITRYTCTVGPNVLELASAIHNYRSTLEASDHLRLKRSLEIFTAEALIDLDNLDPIDDFVNITPNTTGGYKTAAHSNWGNIPAVDSLDELYDCLEQWYMASSSPVIWRGLPRIGYSLDSAIVRKYRWLAANVPHNGRSKKDLLEDYVASVEKHWLNDADGRGHRYHNGRRLSDLELFALFQHQGGPTRLMDFTWNLMVALWFATFAPAHTQSYGFLFGVTIKHNSDITVLRSSDEVQQPITEIVGSKPDGLFIWQPPYINPRMYTQHSVFAFSRCQPSPVGTLNTPDIQPHSLMPIDPFIRVALSPKFKAAMNKRWKNFYGYGPSTIYPDFEGFAQNWEYNNLVPG